MQCYVVVDHKFSEIDDVTPLFNLFLVVHLPTHSVALLALVGTGQHICATCSWEPLTMLNPQFVAE